jgi:aldose 1-epimerase
MIKKLSCIFQSLSVAATMASATLLLLGAAQAGSVASEPFGSTADGKAVQLYTLANDKGTSVKFLSYGGIITQIQVPDRSGRIGNVVLGFKTLAEYESKSPYFGAIVGRYANRIAGGKFSLDGTNYTLALNNGANALHGGKKGFDKVVWTVKPLEGASAELTYTSPDGEEGYPGNLKVRVVYNWTNENELKVEYEATTDKPTIINLTSHSYFNLSGDGAGSIENHILSVNADKFTPVDAGGIPTGEVKSVAGTPFDFRVAKPIGARIGSNDPQMVNGRGYDHNFLVNQTGGAVTLDATLYDPASGRVMDISSDQPGLQFYTGNFLDGTTYGAAGKQYRQGDGLCLETQHMPDSPNHTNFPSTRLDPGKTYKTVTIHKFSTDGS